jgi:deoxyadenosine/deoxycytidine kinase
MSQANNICGNLQKKLRIEICGGIASGKTTLAILLKRAGIEAVLEHFQTNPFWEAFYRDPAAHAFETEVSFLLQHYHQIKIARTDEKSFACDFSLFLDLAYANVTLKGSKLKTFLAVQEEVRREVGLPDLLVHLQCGAVTELERIRRRGRAVEETITLEYLAQLNDAVALQVSHIGEQVRVLTIDSEHLNFADDQKTQQELINEVLQALPRS